MKMIHLDDGIEIAPGKTVILQPGGFHIMFMELNGLLEEGKTYEITLEFKNSGKVAVPLKILGKGAMSFHGEAGTDNMTHDHNDKHDHGTEPAKK